MDGIARSVTARGCEAERVAQELVAGVVGDGLRLAVLFADWRIESIGAAA
jgi:hypothetical protein